MTMLNQAPMLSTCTTPKAHCWQRSAHPGSDVMGQEPVEQKGEGHCGCMPQGMSIHQAEPLHRVPVHVLRGSMQGQRSMKGKAAFVMAWMEGWCSRW